MYINFTKLDNQSVGGSDITMYIKQFYSIIYKNNKYNDTHRGGSRICSPLNPSPVSASVW